MKTLISTTVLSVLLLTVGSHASSLKAQDSSQALKKFVQELNPLVPGQIFVSLGGDVDLVLEKSSSSLDLCQRSVSSLAKRSSLGLRKIYLDKDLFQTSLQTVCQDGWTPVQRLQKAVVQELASMYDQTNYHWQNSVDRAAIRACEQKYPSADRSRAPSLSDTCDYYFSQRSKIARSLPYLALANFSPNLERSKNVLAQRVGDLEQLSSLEQHFSVNMAEFLLDANYACRKPAHHQYFQTLLKWTPYFTEVCAPTRHIYTSQGGWPMTLDPAKVYQVHYLFASQGEGFASRWGHSMIRFVVCAPQRALGPDCLKDERYHVILSFRANVDDVIINNWDGLVGKYPSQALFYSMGEVINEYTREQWRNLISLPLQISREQQNLIVKMALENYWSYSGKYKFISNNCATETDQLFRAMLPRHHSYHDTESLSPLGLYQDLHIHKLIDHKQVSKEDEARAVGLFYPSQKEALLKSLAKIQHRLTAETSLEQWVFATSAQERSLVYKNLSAMGEIGAAYLLEKFASLQASRQLQMRGSQLLQQEVQDAELLQAMQKMRAAGEATLPWNLAQAGYGVPLKSELREAAQIAAIVKSGHEGGREYFKTLEIRFPEWTQEIKAIEENLTLLTNLRRF